MSNSSSTSDGNPMHLIMTLFLFTALLLVGGCTSIPQPAPRKQVVDVQVTPSKTDVSPDVGGKDASLHRPDPQGHVGDVNKTPSKTDLPPNGSNKDASFHLRDPHEHAVNVHAQPWKTELAPDVLILKVPALDKKPHENCVTNQSQTMVAFTIFAGRNPPDWQGEHVYFQRLGANERFVILGIPMGQRDFSDLAWVNDRYLVFDRWSSPHYGMHYIFDAVQKKLLLATPFPDQFYLDQQKKDSTPTPAPPGSKQ